MKFKVKIEKEVEAAVLRIRGKVSDSCDYTLADAKGIEIAEHDGYVPDWLETSMNQDASGGDYLWFDIDIKTGQIIGWKPPSSAALQRWVAELEESR